MPPLPILKPASLIASHTTSTMSAALSARTFVGGAQLTSRVLASRKARSGPCACVQVFLAAMHDASLAATPPPGPDPLRLPLPRPLQAINTVVRSAFTLPPLPYPAVRPRRCCLQPGRRRRRSGQLGATCIAASCSRSFPAPCCPAGCAGEEGHVQGEAPAFSSSSWDPQGTGACPQYVPAGRSRAALPASGLPPNLARSAPAPSCPRADHL